MLLFLLPFLISAHKVCVLPYLEISAICDFLPTKEEYTVVNIGEHAVKLLETP